jgi:hypothetical protein
MINALNVEALKHYEPVISAIDNSKGCIAREALDKVKTKGIA